MDNIINALKDYLRAFLSFLDSFIDPTDFLKPI